MASLTKTLKTQTVNTFGPSPSAQWSSMQWGKTWGMKSAATGGVPAMAWTLFKLWTKTNVITSTLPASSVFLSVNKVKNHALSIAFANTNKQLFAGNGYNYVFPDRVTNIESAAAGTFVSAAAASTTWTSAAAQTTTWS